MQSSAPRVDHVVVDVLVTEIEGDRQIGDESSDLPIVRTRFGRRRSDRASLHYGERHDTSPASFTGHEAAHE